jgi:hypothetical protein
MVERVARAFRIQMTLQLRHTLVLMPGSKTHFTMVDCLMWMTASTRVKSPVL